MNTFTKVSKRFILSAVVMLAVVAVQAQDEEGSSFSFSGSVDTYFRTNLNGPNVLEGFFDVDGDGTPDDVIQAPGSSFANQPGFALGMANLIAGYEGEKVGFVADLVFGPRGTDAVFGSTTASSSIVNQLYTYWVVNDALTLTFGNFNTFLGYEVISPTGNYNYSTSYMFSYGPFSHSGLKADIAIGEASLMLAVLNPTDFTDFNPDGTYYAGAQLGVAGQYFNLLYGGEDGDYLQVDFTGGLDVTDATYVGLNATYNKDLFYGVALYLQQSFSEDFSLGLRGEYFGDDGIGIVGGADESVIDLTLSANYSVGSLTFIPEFRLDSFSQDDVVVTEWDPTDPGAIGTANSLSSFVLAAVYAF